tara:strand:+ start:7260 stop:7664 length:405 start_codon:yes stop_codon:yes gene_type:complete
MTNSTLIKHFLDRSIGWDNLFDSIATNRSNFPPYNILKTEDKGTELQLALAGYSRDDLKVTVQDKVLTISSSGVDKQDDIEYNYRGVAKRAFTINFSLGQYQEVKDVTMKDGMLYISFETVLPEDKKLKTFTIN